MSPLLVYNSKSILATSDSFPLIRSHIISRWKILWTLLWNLNTFFLFFSLTYLSNNIWYWTFEYIFCDMILKFAIEWTNKLYDYNCINNNKLFVNLIIVWCLSCFLEISGFCFSRSMNRYSSNSVSAYQVKLVQKMYPMQVNEALWGEYWFIIGQ